MSDAERIAELEQKVEELLKWKEERERQQIKFPIDTVSANIINNL